MRIEIMPGASGRRWVAEGFQLLRKRPLPLIGITSLYMMIVLLGATVPMVGALLVLLVTPAMNVGILHAVREVDVGGSGRHGGTPAELLDGFRLASRAPLRPLLVLGAVNAGAALVAYLLTNALTDDPLRQFVLTQVLYSPVQIPLWFAPLLVAWHKEPPAKAMFISAFAMWRNWRAFLQFMLAWGVVALLVSLALQMLLIMVGNPPVLMTLLALPLSLIMPSAVFCSLWPTYRDIIRGDIIRDTARTD